MAVLLVSCYTKTFISSYPKRIQLFHTLKVQKEKKITTRSMPIKCGAVHLYLRPQEGKLDLNFNLLCTSGFAMTQRLLLNEFRFFIVIDWTGGPAATVAFVTFNQCSNLGASQIDFAFLPSEHRSIWGSLKGNCAIRSRREKRRRRSKWKKYHGKKFWTL